MFICNIQLKKAKIIKYFLLIFIAFIVSILVIVYSCRKTNTKNQVTDDVPQTEFAEISQENYTNILKDSHENIDMYCGKKIKFTGFVYRLYDFTDTQFVLAREMIISASDTQAKSVVVGFLSDYSLATSFADGTWVEVEATIEKGYYHSDIPILNISSMKQVECPDNPYVYPPDKGYVQTESL